MTPERIDLKALRVRIFRNKVGAGDLDIDAEMTLPTETIESFVAVVEAALRMQAASMGVMDRDAVESQLEFYEADKAMTAALHPFTEST
jgi:hypothetical protein